MFWWSKKALFLVTALFFVLLIVFELRQEKRFEKTLEEFTPRVLITFSNAGKSPQLQNSFRDCIYTLLERSSRVVEINVVGEKKSLELAKRIFDSAAEASKKKGRLKLHELKPLAKIVNDTHSASFQYFRHSENAYYGGSLFFLSLVLHLTFPAWSSVITLDADLRFRGDIHALWAKFRDFRPQEVVGIAHEMQPVYSKLFNSYNKEHKDSKLGEPLPKGFPGFNSGVLLLNLTRIRESSEYLSYLKTERIQRLVRKYDFQGHLGDQDLYTLIGAEAPHLFHPLPCQWNRQLCSWWRDKGFQKVFPDYFSCPEPLFILHGNCHTPIPDY